MTLPSYSKSLLLAATLGLGLQSTAQAQQAANDLMVVFDASGSMWGQVNGTTKIEIARDVFSNLSRDWAAGQQSVGLIAYGHRRKGDCGDIELLARPSVAAAQSMAQIVQGLTPRGKTPLSQAVRMAAQEMKFTENAATVVLLSDGIETCNLDPCAVGQELEQLGVDFTAHVIGFDIQSESDKAQLQCLARNTGGQYLDAKDAGSLSDALSKVTDNAKAPTGTISAHVLLNLAPGTRRPANVTITATQLETGKTKNLGTLTGAAQVLDGALLELPAGRWRFAANGDGGTGEIELDVSKQTQVIRIPFAAESGSFANAGPSEFELGSSFGIKIRATAELQSNATYKVVLLPAGATEYSQNYSFSYRFGSDAEVTEHWFYPDQYGLKAGQYEIVILNDGDYDLNEVLGRFAISLNEPGAGAQTINVRAQFPDGSLPQGQASWSFLLEGDQDVMAPTTPNSAAQFEDMQPGNYDVKVTVDSAQGEISTERKITVGAGSTDFVLTLPEPMLRTEVAYVAEPLTEGHKEAIKIVGTGLSGARFQFQGLNGGGNHEVPISAEGFVSLPSQMPAGLYITRVLRRDGSDTYMGQLQVLPASANNIGDHGSEGEDPNTMMSAEELAAESGPQQLNFSIWAQCDDTTACRVEDRRVNLVWALPSKWASAEPYYYTTAGGGVAKSPTVEMARLDRGSFGVALNPRQWSDALGPCETVPQGRLCRENTEVELDLKDYQIIKSSLMGNTPKPKGWQPLGRTWTIESELVDGTVGLLKIEEPTERSETTTGQIQLANSAMFNLQDTAAVPVEFSVSWNNDPLVTDLFGLFEINGEEYDIRLHRPNDWDGKSNIWRGQVTQKRSFRGLIINIF